MHYKSSFLLLVVLTLFTLSCKKEATEFETVNAKGDFQERSNIVFYFRGTVNGEYKDWTVANHKNGEDLAYRFNTGSGLENLGNDCTNTFCKYLIEDVVIFQNNGAGPTKNYIAAGFNISSKTGSRNEIINQFSLGQKTFGKPRFNISDPVQNGVFVYYIDETGKEWCSHFGSGNQTSSTFRSEELLPQPFSEISCMNIWRADFSCKLYDRNGNSIQLENCEFFTPALVKK